MIKKFASSIIALFVVAAVYAQTAPAADAPAEKSAPATVQAVAAKPASDVNDIAVEYVDYLFADGFKKTENQQKIADLAPLLTAEQRQAYYDENNQFGLRPFLLNLLIGFGVGSFSQGDTKIGALQLVGDLVGDGLLIGGIIGMIGAANDDDVDEAASSAAIASVVCVIGGLITTAVAIPACIRPWFYAKTYNEKLEKALRLDEQNASVSLLPVIEPVRDRYGLAMQVRW